MNSEVKLTLLVEGKQAQTVLQLTDEQLKKLVNTSTTAGQEVSSNFTRITNELKKYEAATNNTVDDIATFIKMQNLSSLEIEQTISALKKETATLAISSDQYKKNQTAILQLSTAYDKLIDEQRQNIPATNRNIQQTGNLNHAFGQLGWVIGDASMFAVNFRMGMMSIGNNIPMVVQEFMRAKESIKGTETTMKSLVMSAITGPGGIMLAINGLMLLLQVLPGLFDDTTESVKNQDEEIKKLKTSYDKLTQAEITNRLTTYRNQLSEFEKTAKPEVEVKQSNTNDGRLIYRTLSPEERYGENYKAVVELETRIKALIDAENELGDKKEIRNRIDQLRELDELLTDNQNKKGYYKNYFPNVKDYNEARATLDQWIAYEESKIKKSRSNKEKETNGLIANIDNELKQLEEKRTLAKTIDELLIIDKKIEKLTDEKKQIEVAVVLKEYKRTLDYDADSIGTKNNKVNKIDSKSIKNKELTGLKTAKNTSDIVEIDIENTKTGLEKELALNELYRNLELKKYKDVVGAKAVIDKKYNANREKLEKQHMLNQLQNASATLGLLAGMLNEHTVAGKAVAIADATIKTYVGATTALKDGGFWGIAQMALVIAAGLAQVSKIASTEVPQYPEPKQATGFAKGGRFPEGKPGFIEGYYNEIIAPEKTFIDVFQNELRPKIYGGSGDGYSSKELLSKIDKLNDNILEVTNRPVIAEAFVTNKTARQIYQNGYNSNQRSGL